MRTLAGLAAVAVLGALAACGSSGGEPAGSATAEIQGGVADPDHPWAVALYNGRGICSGTLIAPNLVLTARHCIAPGPDAILCDDPDATFGPSFEPSSVVVTTRAKLTLGSHNYRARKIVTPAAAHFCGNDIALVILERSVPRTEATPARPAVLRPIGDPALYTTRVTAIGFGRTAPTGQSDSGERRIRQRIPIRCIPGDAALPCKPSVHGRVHPREFVVAPGTCAGDSGSGAYDQASFDRGDPVALGVLSRGRDTETTCLDGTYTRSDSFSELIIDAAVEAAALGGYAEPSWATAPPEPPDGGLPDAAAYGTEDDAGADSGAPADAGAKDAGRKPTRDAGAPPAPPAEDEDEALGPAEPIAPAAREPDPPPAPTVTRRRVTGCAAAPAPARSSIALLVIAGAAVLARARRSPRRSG
jgi:hypothetical protein